MPAEETTEPKQENQENQSNQEEQASVKAQASSEVKANADLAELEESSSPKNKRVRGKERVLTTSMLLEILETAQGRTLSTLVLTVIAVAALILFAIAPALATITSQVEKNDALRDKIQKMSDKYDALNSLKTKQDNNETALKAFDAYFATYSTKDATEAGGKMQKEIYVELSKLAAENNLSFNSIGFAEGTGSQKNYKDLTLSDKLKFQKVKLNLRGSRADLPGFLTALEEQKRIYHLENASITTQKDLGDEDIIDLTIDTIYWQATA